MDGVIVDNNRYHFKAWQAVYQQYGKQLDPAYFRDHLNGRTLSEIVAQMLDYSSTIEEIRKVGLEKERFYRQLYQPHIELTKGLPNLLAEAKKENIPMVVGTSAPVENVSFILDQTNIRHYFTGILDERAVTHGKPDPEIYLKCAEAIGLPNERCIVFEDAIMGIQAGKSAGSKVIALATSHQRNELKADLVIDNFYSISLDQIAALIG